MNRREVLRSLSAVVLASATCFGTLRTAGAGQKAGSEVYAHCAKACSNCATACRACTKHCASMIAAGMKEHEKSKRLSEDCADICALTAKICARRGPATVAICEACAKSCDACGAECGKYPTMKEMKDCAQTCAVCSKICREMVKTLNG
jgi:hypothetical protein